MELRQHRLRSLSLCITIRRVRSFSLWGLFSLTELHRWTEHTWFLLSHRFTQITRVRRFLLSHRFTQMNRTHSIPQRPCGRQISQNLTAIFSWNALWSLYAEGLLWARNVCQKVPLTLCALWEIIYPQGLSSVLKRSVNSVNSVRDNIPTRIKQCAKTLC